MSSVSAAAPNSHWPYPRFIAHRGGGTLAPETRWPDSGKPGTSAFKASKPMSCSPLTALPSSPMTRFSGVS